MELELKQEQLQGFERSREVLLPTEETLEYIVPDYCPDIGRILCCSGTVFLRSKDCQDGRLELGGIVRTTVLYLPENSSAVRSLEVAVPFLCRGEERGLEGNICLQARGQLQEAEARLLNPRKLLLRVSVLGRAEVYQYRSLSYTAEAVAEEDMELQQRKQCGETDIICCVKEKDFTFMDEICIPAGREEIGELLQCDSRLELAESRVLGKKLLLKGTVLTQLLYRGREGGLCTWQSDLPLTQVVELEEAAENCSAEVSLQQLGCEYQQPENEGRTVTLNLFLRCQLTLRESRAFSWLADAYSTRFETQVQRQQLPLVHWRGHPAQRQTLREVLETGAVVKTVLSARGHCEAVRCSREGALLTMHSTVELSVLYLDENDTPLLAERRLEVSHSCQVGQNSHCSAEIHCGDISCAAAGNGMELRFCVDFTLQEFCCSQESAVTELCLGEPLDFSKAPSIVLRSLQLHESLWEVAKRYSSTEEEIRRANELEEEAELPAGRLLLIPRCRK